MTLPLAVSPSVTGLMFLLMEDMQFGVLAYRLRLIGLADPGNPILANRWTTLPGVVLVDI